MKKRGSGSPTSDLPDRDPPKIDDHHVRLPEQVATLLGADPVHQRGITGRGVRVAVIDSGFYVHPFFSSRGYQITHVTTTDEPEPHVDEYGHGTAQLASLFAMAPEAEILAIKCMDRDPTHALEIAIGLKPQILTCAWGFNIDKPGKKKLPAEFAKTRELILAAQASGITVIAAAGNGQYSFPGCMPEVVCAGGVYYSSEGRFELSDLSSRYQSSIYPGRFVPDICGIVGNRPHGRLLLVPVPPEARLAKRPAFSAIAAGRASRLSRSGWAMFSGTSASTAMVAGAAALCLQAAPGLAPQAVKSALVDSALCFEDPEPFRVVCADAAVRHSSRARFV